MGLWRVLWRDLPLVNFAVYAVGIGHAEIANLVPARPDLFFSFVFPLSVPTLIYALRWPRANRIERGVALTVIVGSLLLLMVSYFGAWRTPLASASLRSIYEVAAILNTLALGWHAWTQSRAMAAFFLGPAALYGVMLENGGILLGYFTELEYGWYLGPLPAPLATMAGWVTVFYLVVQVAWYLRELVPRIKQSASLSALASMFAALLLDLQIDPMATAVGFWRWNPLLAKGPMGVPLLNFVAWGCAVLPFAWLLFRRQDAYALTPLEVTAKPHRTWMWSRTLVALTAATGLFLVTMTLIEGGMDGPTCRILRTALATLLL